MGCRANVRQPIWHHSISPFATSFSFLADSTSFSASSHSMQSAHASPHPDSHDRRHTQRDVFDAVLPVHHRRHRQNRALIADDTLADTFYRHRNSVIRRLFFRNNLVSTVFDLLRDRVHRRIVVKMPAHLAEIVQRNARYIRTAPCRDPLSPCSPMINECTPGCPRPGVRPAHI